VYWTDVSGDTWSPERRSQFRDNGGMKPGVVLMHDFERSDTLHPGGHEYVLRYLEHILEGNGRLEVCTVQNLLRCG